MILPFPAHRRRESGREGDERGAVIRAVSREKGGRFSECIVFVLDRICWFGSEQHSRSILRPVRNAPFVIVVTRAKANRSSPQPLKHEIMVYQSLLVSIILRYCVASDYNASIESDPFSCSCFSDRSPSNPPQTHLQSLCLAVALILRRSYVVTLR